MNHVKDLRAGPAEMPFQNWYTANTNQLGRAVTNKSCHTHLFIYS